MQDFFRNVLNQGMLNLIEHPEMEDDSMGPRFRGANTPLLIDGEFITDSESHCPRVATLRKRGIQVKPQPKNILSWCYGRAWEAMMKKLVDEAKIPNLSYLQEEECPVLIYEEGCDGDEDKIIYSARPDLLVQYNDKKFLVECKSCQSNNGALDIFTHGKPKLGAFLQLGVAMLAHECDIAYTCYGLMHWVQGYDFSTRKPFKNEPDYATQFAELRDDGYLYCGGRKTVVCPQASIDGIHALNQLDTAGVFLGARPKGVDIFGNKMKYDVCGYCPFNPICSQYVKTDEIQIDDFIESVKLEVDVHVKA